MIKIDSVEITLENGGLVEIEEVVQVTYFVDTNQAVISHHAEGCDKAINTLITRINTLTTGKYVHLTTV